MPTKATARRTAGNGYKRVEKHIYAERRSAGSVRFTVQVTGQPKSHRTFDLADEKGAGLAWARQERLRLLGLLPVDEPVPAPRRDAPALALAGQHRGAGNGPGQVRVDEVLSHYEEHGLPKLSPTSRSPQLSRLNKLRAAFGPSTLADLTEERLEAWKAERARGVQGGARSTWRKNPGCGSPVLTKDQRRRRRLRGAGHSAVSTAEQGRPASQTVRHELRLLRSAFQLWFASEPWRGHRAWLGAQPVMTMTLPPAAEPRSQRISDADAERICAHSRSKVAKAAFRFSRLQTLRRAETVSLRWEDFDFERQTFTLRAPAHDRKSKTKERQVPLLQETVALLDAYGIEKTGPVFPITTTGLTQALRRAADRAGLPHVRLHDARREGVSRLADANLTTSVIRAFTGHETEDALNRFYCRPDASAVARLADQMLEKNGGRA